MTNNDTASQMRKLVKQFKDSGQSQKSFGAAHGLKEGKLYSFFGSCKMQKINPREWLQGTLQKIPDHSIRKLEELLPGYQENITT